VLLISPSPGSLRGGGVLMIDMAIFLLRDMAACRL
jgi:hypothetical protein